jgi:hypothetical protein
MGGYPIELTTPRGTYSTRFTIDDDRPLGLQLHHVVEELQQQDVVLAGAPGDELVAVWSDELVDVSQSPAQLGISPFRPIQLRMQPRLMGAPAEVPRWRLLLQSATVLMTVLAGAGAALLVWALVSSHAWMDLTLNALQRTEPLDGALLGVAIGALANTSISIHTGTRVRSSAMLGALLGAVAGAVAGGLSVSVREVLLARDDISFTLARLLTWGTLGAMVGAALGLQWWRTDRGRTADGAMVGAVSGIISAFVFQFAGPSDAAHAVSFLFFGAGMGASQIVPLYARARGVLTLERAGGRRASVWRLREMTLTDGQMVQLQNAADVLSCRSLGAVMCVGNAFRLVSPLSDAQALAHFAVSGRPVSGPVDLHHGDTIELGDSVYRFHRVTATQARGNGH